MTDRIEETAEEFEQRITDRQNRYSIRNALRFFAGVRVDPRIMGWTIDEIVHELLKDYKKVTMAEIGSARQFAVFIKKGNNRNYITDNVDGRLEQSVNIPLLKQLLSMTDEELQNVVQNDSAGTGNATNASAGNAGIAAQTVNPAEPS